MIAKDTRGHSLEYFDKLSDHVEGMKKGMDVVSGIRYWLQKFPEFARVIYRNCYSEYRNAH
jgi:uncharacterized NAD-dependent epimerase/dehydratase family protein